jgi:hypothetical protein
MRASHKLATAIAALLLITSNVFSLTQISGSDLQALIESGEKVVVPAGDTYVIVLPDGKEVKLIEGTTFSVVDKDGKIRVVRGDRTPGPRPPYERMKELPRKIVEENLSDVSPS